MASRCINYTKKLQSKAVDYFRKKALSQNFLVEHYSRIFHQRDLFFVTQNSLQIWITLKKMERNLKKSRIMCIK